MYIHKQFYIPLIILNGHRNPLHILKVFNIFYYFSKKFEKFTLHSPSVCVWLKNYISKIDGKYFIPYRQFHIGKLLS